jgi:serine/threonine-protein kinase
VSESPARLGPYEIRSTIGAGGMGVVYLAWDARLRRSVALKTLHSTFAQDAVARERFLREARAVAAISHPNVTQIYDIGEDEGRPYFAMEYLEGRSVQDLLDELGSVDPELAVSIARQTAAGLKAAAERGIVHRDVKPSNLFLAKDGTLKVTDFGLAKQLVADSKLTSDGQFFGTPNYIAPEQASGGRADARSDIYSLGATMYEMLTGKPPFVGESPVTVVMQHLRDPVPPLRQSNPDVPIPLAGLIHKMLSKSPSARPQDYDELVRLLDRNSATIACATTPAVAIEMPDADAPTGRSAGRLAAYCVLGVVAIAAIGIWIEPDMEKGPEPERVASGAAPRLRAATDTRPAVDVAPPPSRTRSVTRARPDVSIHESSHEWTPEGMLRIFGRLQNTGQATAEAVIVRVVLTDEAGQQIDSLEVPALPPRLDAGAMADFEAYFANPRRKVSILVELHWLS